MAYSNPLPIDLHAFVDYTFTATSNAAYNQSAVIYDNEGNEVCNFSGSGEGVSMTTEDGSTSFVINYLRKSYTYKVLFQANDGTGWTASQVVVNISESGTQIIGTEDFNDGDDNDTVMKIASQTQQG